MSTSCPGESLLIDCMTEYFDRLTGRIVGYYGATLSRECKESRVFVVFPKLPLSRYPYNSVNGDHSRAIAATRLSQPFNPSGDNSPPPTRRNSPQLPRNSLTPRRI